MSQNTHIIVFLTIRINKFFLHRFHAFYILHFLMHGVRVISPLRYAARWQSFSWELCACLKCRKDFRKRVPRAFIWYNSEAVSSFGKYNQVQIIFSLMAPSPRLISCLTSMMSSSVLYTNILLQSFSCSCGNYCSAGSPQDLWVQ